LLLLLLPLPMLFMAFLALAASAAAAASTGAATDTVTSTMALASAAFTVPPSTPDATAAWNRHSATRRRSCANHSARRHGRPRSSRTISSAADAAKGSVAVVVAS
jgi:hypothetical protein